MPKTLLVADDSVTIRKVIGMIFSTEDFTITSVDNGLDAVARAREIKPDLVLADAVMPGKNGYEVCEALKSDPETESIPVVLLGGTFEAFDANRARAARADDHIMKPFESNALLDKVRNLIGGVKPSSMPAAQTWQVPGAAQAPRGPQIPQAQPAGGPLPRAPQPAPTPVSRAVPPSATPVPSAPRAMTPGPQPVRAASPASAPQGFAPRPVAPSPGASPMPMPGVPGASPVNARTGFPSAPMPGQPMARPGAPLGAGGQPVTRPGVPAAQGPHPMSGSAGARPPPSSAAGVSAALAGIPPEVLLREVLSKASRELIEKIVWEVVPQLAETVIREHVERLARERETQH